MASADRPAVWPLSSPILAGLAGGGPVEAGPVVLDLVDRLAQIDDPRQVSWVEHPLPVVLALCAGAVVAGMASFTAIASWVTDVPIDLLTGLHARCGQIGAVARAPSKATLWRVVTEIDPVQVDAVIGAWLLERAHRLNHPDRRPATDTAPAENTVAGLDAVAVDGKTVRGAKDSEGNQTHLLAAMTHTGLVAGQVEVGAKTNEIPKLSELLDTLDITGVVITADAMHTQRDTADYLHQRGADFCFCVKENQPTLFTTLDALPWNDVPITHTTTERGHGRIERRTIQVLPAPDDLPFPHINQVTLIERYVTDLKGNPTSAVAVLGITSLAATHANPTRLAALTRNHWGIESLHWLRDTVYREDNSRTRTRSGPRIMAGLRNLAIGAIRLTGRTDITETNRWANRNMHRPFQILELTS
jgi:predicted transposase YbfD/YdcC